jgi:hypothetical protein
MSKLTETSRLKIEDFQKQRDWIGGLLEGYNNFLTQAIRILNKGLTFADNIVGVDHQFEFTFQTQAISFPQKIKWPYDRLTPRHLFHTYSSEEGINVPVIFSWRFNDDRFIELSNVYKITSSPAVTDLVAGSKYIVRVRIEP